MMAIARAVAVGVVLAGAAIGVASLASAELGEGSYAVNSTGGGGGMGIHSQWVVTPCGQGCLTVRFSNGETTDFHLQGNTWTGANAAGCIWTVDNNSLAGLDHCPAISIDVQLTKNG
jgi:hypothetical protein